MTTAKRDVVAKNILDQRRPRKVGRRKPNHVLRGHRHLVTLTDKELSRREKGWNNRFTIDPPPKSNKVPSPAHSPTFSTPPTPLTKEFRMQNERAQYGKCGDKRYRTPIKPSSGKLVPLGTLSKPPSEAVQSTKEDKLRFRALKAIDARETLLYQLSALILCTPVQETLFIPSRPTEPLARNSASWQQMRSRGGMALAPTPLSRHGGGSGVMTNAREATKLAQQLATGLQVTGIQCVEALVEWMLEAGARTETPPTFMWRGRNYFLKMLRDLDFAQAELLARGVHLGYFKQHNPLLIKSNQKLGRVLAAHSIIMEMIEFAKDVTPIELLALSGRMRDPDGEETEASDPLFDVRARTSGLGATNSNTKNPAMDVQKMLCETMYNEASERHDCESAAELANLLDESMDFTRERALREGATNQDDIASNEFGDDEENIKPATLRRTAGTLNNLEPDNRKEALEISKAEDPIFVGEFMVGIDSNDEQCVPGNTVPQLAPEVCTLPAEDAVHPEQPNDNPADAISPEIEADITRESGVDTEQPHSSRLNVSDNQLEYGNSFDVNAGGDEIDEESVNVQYTEQFSDVSESAVPERYKPGQTTLPEDSTHNEAINASVSRGESLSCRSEDILSGAEDDNSFNEDVDDWNPATSIDTDTAARITDSAVIAHVPVTIYDVPLITMQSDERIESLESEHRVHETDDPQALSKRLEIELKRWTFLDDENRPTEVNARGCRTWHITRALKGNLQQHSSISECMEGSIISMLEQYGLLVPESPLKSLLCSDVARELDLASRLVEECHAVLDDICSLVAEAIQTSLRVKNSLVSEIEIQEVLETAEAVRLEYHCSTWQYVKIASTLLVFLVGDNDALASVKCPLPFSSGPNPLVKMFYPYLLNKPREELRDNWHPVTRFLAAMGLPIEDLYILLDPMCKTLLLAVKLCSRSTQDSQDDGDLVVFPNATVVCDREDILQSSVEYVWRTHLSSEKPISNFCLSPFFKSSFGEKLVDGVKVEEGEGKGPLKEWFTLVGAQLTSKWKPLPTSKVLTDADSTQVTANGNTITIPGASDVIFPGFLLEWETIEGETNRRVVNKTLGNHAFLLDRSVPSCSFVTCQLRISQPITAIFEYVQGSETYWLNENTCNSLETRHALGFVGWLLASAITHFCPIQLRIHLLFFRLLLNPQHCVTLEEIRVFDPPLFKSLSMMRNMKPLDFAQFLKYEGADDALSVEAYISNVLEEKFGPASGIGWQLQIIRCGFTRVVGIDLLGSVGISEADLVESICGSSSGPSDDFFINEVFRVVADTDFTDCQPLMNVFWQTVNGFEPHLKRKLIKFVTGVDTLPLAGTEFLRIEMPFTAISSDDHKKCLQMLPQAHTCDNTLELPNYWKALCWREQHDEHEANSKLEEKLKLLLSKKLYDAVEYSSGYGLDGTSAVADEESYDSLDIPALSDGYLLDKDAPLSPQRLENDEVETDAALAADSEANPAESPAVDVPPRPEESYEDDYDDWEEEPVTSDVKF
ncbi:HECT domain-containing protein [Phytophthora infestans]|uniref:HECT-type E3 ubiquitin transferase n=1 Tax=Phytophthora infestans TaxID=4787 RepID=A0A833WPR6_PHYIN|nr:HECT domain-containing protein [Phytophthora infestans]